MLDRFSEESNAGLKMRRGGRIFKGQAFEDLGVLNFVCHPPTGRRRITN
ncbi:MAG: hypothetical protein AAB669_03000 [Patescibacteria group bacterium]